MMTGRYVKIMGVCITGGIIMLLLIPLQNMRNTSNRLQALLVTFSQNPKALPAPKYIAVGQNYPGRKLPEVDNSILASLRSKGLVKNLPGGEEIKHMDADRIWKTYYSFTDNIDIICDRRLRMGKVGDGGWEVCDDPPYRPVKPCVVYSFGINNDFSFDDDMSNVYGCDVYSFDPSMSAATHRRNAKNMFYKIGIGGKDETKSNKWSLMTLTSIRKMLNHTKTIIDVLKMDTEGAEWSAIPSAIKAGELNTVRQLLMEFHTGGQKTAPQGIPKLQLMSDVERLGFRKFLVHKNPACVVRLPQLFPLQRSACQEIHYVNTNVLP